MPFLIHLLQTCKPDFVPLRKRWLSFIWLLHYCNNLAAYPSASGEQPSSDGYRSADIRGIAVHKVYP